MSDSTVDIVNDSESKTSFASIEDLLLDDSNSEWISENFLEEGTSSSAH